MIANPAIAYPAGASHPLTLNDMRVHTTTEQETPPASALPIYGLALVLAIAGFVWVDPLHLRGQTEAMAPAPVFVPSVQPVRTTERQEIMAPLPTVRTPKSVEAPVAPAPAARTPQIGAPVVRTRAASGVPPSRGNTVDRTNTTAPQARQPEVAAPAVPPTMPEVKVNPPVVPKLGDEARSTPRPATTNLPSTVTE